MNGYKSLAHCPFLSLSCSHCLCPFLTTILDPGGLIVARKIIFSLTILSSLSVSSFFPCGKEIWTALTDALNFPFPSFFSSLLCNYYYSNIFLRGRKVEESILECIKNGPQIGSIGDPEELSSFLIIIQVDVFLIPLSLSFCSASFNDLFLPPPFASFQMGNRRRMKKHE